MKHKMEDEESKQLSLSGSRRMRSQAAPEWSVEGELILVNEIAVVQADFSNSLSSYQMWSMIAETCTALDKPRTLNQCRRKWDSLVAEYNKIKRWELRSGRGLYWSLDSERRKGCGLPESFDNELFKAIDNLLRARKSRSDTDTDSDPKANVEVLHVAAELGLKRQRRRLTSPKSCVEKKPLISYIKEELPRSPAEENPQKRDLEDPVTMPTEENLQDNYVKEKQLKSDDEYPVKIPKEEKPKRSHDKRKPQKARGKEKEMVSTEEQEQTMIMKLQENTELIDAIVSETLDLGDADVKNKEDYQTAFARCQGDRLILCLKDIVHNLDQLRDVSRI